MLYTTFLNAILVPLAIVSTTTTNSSCSALCCACTDRTHASLLYFDLYFLLGTRVWIEGMDNRGLDDRGWTVVLNGNLFRVKTVAISERFSANYMYTSCMYYQGFLTLRLLCFLI